MTAPADKQPSPVLVGGMEIPDIIERGNRGEKLTEQEQAAWTGYELGWRDGRNDALASPLVGMGGLGRLRAEEQPCAPGIEPEQASEVGKVWVVMGNDYPDAVFDTEEGADIYIVQAKANTLTGYGPRIYWRTYEFALNGARL